MLQIVSGILVTSGLVLFGAPTRTGVAAKGKALYATCMACHGAKGEGLKEQNSPQIAGLEDWYLERQLDNFKKGIRGGDPKDVLGMQMRPMAMALATPKAMADMVAYLSQLKQKRPKKTFKGNKTKGRALYATCSGCHGAKAEGMKSMNAPRLTGLQDWYLLNQLKLFKSGVRGRHPKDVYGLQMAPAAMTLANEKAMKDVIAYIYTFNK